MATPSSPPPGTSSARQVVGRSGFFALSFGTIVGSAWLAVLGHWLSSAGPGGALLGFGFGAGAVVLIALCYGELAARLPHAGGEFLYVLRGLGDRAAFTVGWFLTLDAIAVCAFEGIVLAMFVGKLLPGLIGTPLYSVLGHDISWSTLLLGWGTATLLGFLNCRGLKLSIAFQRLATFSFLAVAVGLLAGGFLKGDLAHLQPWFASTTEQPWWLGTVWIFATCALFLNGFQISLYTIEERRRNLPIRSAIAMMLWGLIAAVAFYCLIVLSAGSLLPQPTLLAAELPAVAAYSQLGRARLMESLILAIACVSLLKTWNALVIFGSQLLVAQAAEGMIPAALARLHPHTGAPTRAIVFISVSSMALILLGRGAVLPIVNMVSICLSLTFVVSLLALLRLRAAAAGERDAPIAFKVPGGNVVIRIALAGALAMAAVALFEPAIRVQGIPVEWLLLAIWAALGLLFYRRRRAGNNVAEFTAR